VLQAGPSGWFDERFSESAWLLRVTLADRLDLLAFDLILLGWPTKEIALVYESAYWLKQMERQGRAG
jgi:hypothetical protein